MKKLILTVLALLLCISFCLPVTAGAGTSLFEVSGPVLTVRFPEGSEPVFSFYTGTWIPEKLTEGETVDGFTSISYVLPKEALTDLPLFNVTVDLSAGAGTDLRTALISTMDGGDLYLVGCSAETPDYFTDCSEGYEYSDGRTLYIRLPGSPYTGYEWSCIPDNSGILQLVDNYEVDMRQNDTDPMVTGSGFFFLPVENPAGTEGSIRFTLDTAPEGQPVGTVLEFGFSLAEDGQIGEVFLR